MKHLRWIPLLLLFGLATMVSSQSGDEWKLPPETSRFKPDAGAELAIGNCLLCHSADYVDMQPPLDREAWKAIVEKMRAKYGAPLPAEMVDPVVEYLTRNYGKNSPR